MKRTFFCIIFGLLSLVSKAQLVTDEKRSFGTMGDLLPLASNGDAIAQNKLGLCFIWGVGADKNNELAVTWFTKSAKLNNTDAQYNLAFCYRTGIGVTASIKDWVYWLTKSADNGCASAQILLSECYADDDMGINANFDLALKYAKMAADQNDANGLYKMGCYYLNAEEDIEKAKEYFLRSAQQDETDAMVELGDLLLKEAVFEEAFVWLRKADTLGNSDATVKLFDCYHDGIGVAVDIPKSMEYLQKAADAKNCSALYKLGLHYRYGVEVDVDYQKAFSLFSLASETGEDLGFGSYAIGEMYENGLLGDNMLDKALFWYEKSAQQRNEQAIEAINRHK